MSESPNYSSWTVNLLIAEIRRRKNEGIRLPPHSKKSKVELIDILETNDDQLGLHRKTIRKRERVPAVVASPAEPERKVYPKFYQKRLDNDLLNAVEENNIYTVKKLITQGANINTVDNIGNTPLIIAAIHDYQK